jgi:DNA-binding NtrC family response regulator
VNRGTFREDLFYRLAVVRVRLPSLRARREDVPMLVRHFMERFGATVEPSAELLASLAQRPWPGNVRELRNAVERALAMNVDLTARGAATEAPPDTVGLLAQLLELPWAEAQERWVAHFELAYVREALRRSGGSVTEAAQRTGVTRRHVQRVMRRLGLRNEEGDDT